MQYLICKLCHPLCSRCFYEHNSTCYACKTGAGIIESAIRTCDCASGYYYFGGKCMPCHLLCSICTGSATNCSICSTSSSLIQYVDDYKCQCKNKSRYSSDIGTCICNSNYYYETLYSDCLPCHYSCQECFNGTNDTCDVCKDKIGLILQGTSCTCKIGYYSTGLQELPC